MKTMRFAFIPLALAAFSAASSDAPSKPTSVRHVAPILYNKCVECHRQGAIGPIAFTSYREVLPWARSIKERSVAKSMPPSLGPSHGRLENAKRLTTREIETIVAWVEAGAPEGDARDMPTM
jgi:hypothetical protein